MAKVSRNLHVQVRVALFYLALSTALVIASAFAPRQPTQFSSRINLEPRYSSHLCASETEVSTPAPVLDGNRVLPFKIMNGGLKGHKVAAVYALLNSDYKRGYVMINIDNPCPILLTKVWPRKVLRSDSFQFASSFFVRFTEVKVGMQWNTLEFRWI